MSGVTWVFGGGGVGAIAWETGMLAGLLDEGVAVDSADRLRAQGRNPLRLEIVPAVVAAGREQGRRDASLVRSTTRR